MIQVLDCTLRDGGYYTNWDFEENLTKNYFESMEKLPVQYIEIGYRSLLSNDYKGEYNFCPDYVISRARKYMPSKKIGVILNEKEIRVEDLDRLLGSCKGKLDFIRMAVDPSNLGRAKVTAAEIRNMGFEVGFNVMYMSKWTSQYPDFINSLLSLNGVVDSFAMVDSFGSMMPEQISQITKAVKSVLKCKIGFHGHNNIELAFANTLAAIDAGCDIVDATITGMGRGAGNLRTELLLSYLSSNKGLEIDFNSLSTTVADFERLKEKYRWGTNLPYMVSGFNSLPQKDVMDWVTRRFYSINSILQALNNMKDKKGDNLKLPQFNAERRHFDLAVIIGGGPSGASAAYAVKQLIKKQNNRSVCLIHASSKNAGYYNDIDIPQYFCLVGNEGHRLEKVFADFNLECISCVLPPYPRKMGTYIPEKLKDKSFELASVTFSDLYQDSHTALALQTALEISANTIYIAGYDGYDGLIGENERMLTQENEYLLARAVNENPEKEIATITATKYNGVKNISVYGLLIK